eukprot:UC4_evm1s1021
MSCDCSLPRIVKANACTSSVLLGTFTTLVFAAAVWRTAGLHLVNPGEVITEEEGFMRGHGTILRGGHLVASVSGVVERTNKVVSVRPARSRYVGEIGDVVVG